MPKKPPKNAFYFYMQSFREEQRHKGIEYSLAQAAEAAGPSWREASPEVRSKFEAMASRAKQKFNPTNEKYTSAGVPLSHIARQEREKQEAEENQKEDIIKMVKLRALDGSLLQEDFYIMDINYYCKANTGYIVGESTLLRFNLQDGIKDTYHEIINPGKIPMGYTYDVTLGCKELGLEMPDESSSSNYIQILANIIDYLKQQRRHLGVLPPVFTELDKVQPVCDFITQMCYRAGEDDTLFRVYRLDRLLFTLANALKKDSLEGFPKESLAVLQLKKDSFKYCPGIGCEYHEETDKSMECSLARAKRWSYTVMDFCCGLAGVEMLPGKHVPDDFDMESILAYHEQKRSRVAASVAGREPSSRNTPAADDSMSSACGSRSGQTGASDAPARLSAARGSRVHVPQRMPKADYSKKMLAPELTEDDFPSLSLRGRGRGMGTMDSFTRK